MGHPPPTKMPPPVLVIPAISLIAVAINPELRWRKCGGGLATHAFGPQRRRQNVLRELADGAKKLAIVAPARRQPAFKQTAALGKMTCRNLHHLAFV